MTTADPLVQFRGAFPSANFNARRVAAALEAPGCHRRTLLDASLVHLEKLGALVTGDEKDRQSPFAITRGNKFEASVTDNGMATLLALARKHLGLSIPEARQRDLSAASVRDEFPGLPLNRLNERRALLTRQLVEQMLSDPAAAINLLRHAMTTIDFGGKVVYLEQDALAFAVNGRIHITEIKSFASIDGRADPAKASATVRQTAVYVLSLQNLVESLGASRDLVDTRVLIVLPENLSFKATGVVVDTRMQVRRLQRQLAEVPRVVDVLEGIPPGTTLPALNSSGSQDDLDSARSAAMEVLAHLPARFGEGCVPCPLFKWCRGEAENQHSIARLGNTVAGACGGVTTINTALDLAAGLRQPANPSEVAVAAMLARSAAAITHAVKEG